MKPLLASALLLLATCLAPAAVQVGVGDISDKRTTGQFFKGLEIELKLSGPELAECKGVRIITKEAKDDTGKVIKVKEDRFDSNGFESLDKNYQNFGEKEPGASRITLQLENPARAAKSLTLDATLEVSLPGKDPESVISTVFAKEAGKPLEHPGLAKAGATIELKAVKGSEVSYALSDPNNKVANIEFYGADGKALQPNGRMSTGFGGPKKNMTLSFNGKNLDGLVMKVFLVTEKSVVKVPITLTNVPLP